MIKMNWRRILLIEPFLNSEFVSMSRLACFSVCLSILQSQKLRYVYIEVTLLNLIQFLQKSLSRDLPSKKRNNSDLENWMHSAQSMVTLDGNSEIGAHVMSNICYLICLRHLINSRAFTNRIFFIRNYLFSPTRAMWFELPSYTSTMAQTESLNWKYQHMLPEIFSFSFSYSIIYLKFWLYKSFNSI